MKKLNSLCILILIICINTNITAQIPKAVYFERQEIDIKDFPATGLILDIGGGGEGVIGQLKGNQVVSIDPSKDELINAPSRNLKILMDGCDLKFLDNTFNTAAIFYTMMYIPADDHAKVLQEVKRVLKHGGRLLIWDVNLPVWSDTSKLYGIYRFKFNLPNTEITTGYGTRFPKNKDLNMQYYIELAKLVGFKVTKTENNGNSFFIELQTPPSVSDTVADMILTEGIQVALQKYNTIKQTSAVNFYFGADVFVQLYNDLLKSGKIDESLQIFKMTRKEYGLDERQINSFGYKLLNMKKYKEALDIFQLNADTYPLSANVYDSLAEAFMMDGQKKEAIKNYQKTLELDPTNQNAIDNLKKLKE